MSKSHEECIENVHKFSDRASDAVLTRLDDKSFSELEDSSNVSAPTRVSKPVTMPLNTTQPRKKKTIARRKSTDDPYVHIECLICCLETIVHSSYPNES